MIRKWIDRSVANLRLGTGIVILAGLTATVLLAQQGVGFFNRILIGPANECTIKAGSGSPAGAVAGNICDAYLRTNGSSGTILYLKTTAGGTSGWETAGAGGTSGTGASPLIVIRKTADQSVTSSTALVDATQLGFNIAASETWRVHLILFVDAGATGDLKIGLTVPSGATYTLARTTLTNTSTTIDQAAVSTTTLAVGGIGGGTTYEYTFDAVVVNSTTAGTVQLQFAQNTSDGTATTLKTNSAMIAEPVGAASAATTAGSLVLLETKTASTSADLRFTAGITSAYDDYVLEATALVPSTNAGSMRLEASTDGGSTWVTTSYIRSGQLTHNGSATVTGVDDTNRELGGTVLNTGFGLSARVQLKAVRAATARSFPFTSTWRHSADSNYYQFAGILANTGTTAFNAVRLIYDNGNIASGYAALYGVSTKAQLPPQALATGAWSARTTPIVDGRIYLPNDGYSLGRDSSSTWATWGPLFPFTAPSDTGFSWINQGSTTLTTTQDALVLNKPAAGNVGANLSLRVKTAPTAPYTITAAFLLSPVNSKPSLTGGLCFRQSSDGKLVCTFAQTDVGTSVRSIHVLKYTNETTASTDYTTFAAEQANVVWYRIQDDNTNRKTYISADGQTWTQIHTIGRTDFLTADQVGFFVQASNAATPNIDMVVTLLSWKES